MHTPRNGYMHTHEEIGPATGRSGLLPALQAPRHILIKLDLIFFKPGETSYFFALMKTSYIVPVKIVLYFVSSIFWSRGHQHVPV